jgi:hypothetical protein
MPRRLVTQAQYAKKIRKSPQYVSKLVSQGKIPREKDGRIDVARADRARKAWSLKGNSHRSTRKAAAAPVRTAGPGGRFQPVPASYNSARTRRELAQAEITELDLRQKKGELLPAAAVLEAERRKNSNLRTRFRRLARSVAAEVSRLTDPVEVEDALLRQIDQVLTELALDPLGRVAGPVASPQSPVASEALQTSSVLTPPVAPAETGALSV